MSKQHLIGQYVAQHLGESISTNDLALEVGVSLPTVLTYIKNHPDQFEKVSRGRYLIKSVNAYEVTNVHLSEAFIEASQVSENAQHSDAIVTVTPVGDTSTPINEPPRALGAMQLPDYDPDKW